VTDEAFDIRQEDSGQRYRLVVTGDLNVVSAPDLEAAITRLCTAGALEIELDLRGLTFMDSMGIRAILAARNRCADHHSEFFLIPGRHPDQARLFEMTGLNDAALWRDAQAERTDA
jgi:anti-sigma B factor antagonist